MGSLNWEYWVVHYTIMYIYVLGKCSKNHHTYAWNNYSYKKKNNLVEKHNLMWKSLISPNNMQFYFIYISHLFLIITPCMLWNQMLNHLNSTLNIRRKGTINNYGHNYANDYSNNNNNNNGYYINYDHYSNYDNATKVLWKVLMWHGQWINFLTIWKPNYWQI